MRYPRDCGSSLLCRMVSSPFPLFCFGFFWCVFYLSWPECLKVSAWNCELFPQNKNLSPRASVWVKQCLELPMLTLFRSSCPGISVQPIYRTCSQTSNQRFLSHCSSVSGVSPSSSSTSHSQITPIYCRSNKLWKRAPNANLAMHQGTLSSR